MSKKLNRTEAAERLGVSTETLRRWEIEGKGPRLYRLSSKILFYVIEDLDAWMESKCIEPEDAYNMHKTQSDAQRLA